MKLILNDQNQYIVRIDKEEEILEKLTVFATEQGISAASFSIIGAVGELELWWYDPAVKEYKKKEFQEQLEIVNMTGNVAVMDEKRMVHAHGTFSGKEYSVIAGHVNRALVSGACEVSLQALKGKIERFYDEDIGLNLLS